MSNWISVKDRLPEELKSVALVNINIFMNRHHVRNKHAVGYFEHCLNVDVWQLDGEGSTVIDAFTHWMPLPETPKEEINNLQEPITLEEADEQCFYDERDK